MRRPQFSLKTLLWLMAVVEAFFGGTAWQQRKLGDKLRGAEETQKMLLQVNRDYARAALHARKLGRLFTVHDLQTRRAVMVASIVVGALAGFGFYEFQLRTKNDGKLKPPPKMKQKKIPARVQPINSSPLRMPRFYRRRAG